ncbi:hypothetical protein HPE56_14315 [Maribacter sp. ANRC-HE7]|uniref:Uncharacterized protein n=1 Tax=Maribacter aquimaris TaxID=2737171 RepID=A0ABR7V6N7_9FLAO|nr:hypothetical protein [Maribacter aquimaris]MBD0778971.1 hypothetical protein [Maribacter aquimaris]
MNTIKTLRKRTPKINLIIYLLFAVVLTGFSKDDGMFIILESTHGTNLIEYQ